MKSVVGEPEKQKRMNFIIFIEQAVMIFFIVNIFQLMFYTKHNLLSEILGKQLTVT